MKSLADIFEHTLQDVYYAENAIMKALPNVAKAAKSTELKKAARITLRKPGPDQET
jgi:ferritin-like metal-binding protein YciE